MRMVYTHAPEEVFYPARDRLVESFTRWARIRGREVDPFVVEALVEHRWADGDGLLCRWSPADLAEALLDWFPRAVSVTASERTLVLPTVAVFVDYLFTEDLADALCAGREELHAALSAMTGEFDAAMADEYGAQRLRDKALTLMVVNKTGTDLTSPLSIAGFHANRKAQRFTYGPADLAAIARGADLPVTGGTISATYPANSITLLVLPARRH
ncbi:hypothetical protein [Virgisporangium aliadipatigenens]|uniref:hypothetical protein n=1 Tax=Virgisporangium aliadipatigenens TaxID=741659 RepID=UPI001943C01C|nr:hypothetical protein [Virgisporangium aliadipatigenens]